jgi:preprotein translocase subunit SecA
LLPVGGDREKIQEAFMDTPRMLSLAGIIFPSMSIFTRIFSDEHAAALKKAERIVAPTNAREQETQALSDDALRAKTDEFKKRAASGEDLTDIAPEAFAVVREASRRTTGLRHFDVQLVGGMVLHNGDIAEMRTGEGKTLVATLPVYLNALTDRGVHVITVNDYLSRRDAVWMGQVYAFLGLSVGILNHEESFLYDAGHTNKDEERDELGSYKVVHEFLRPCTRREAYLADVTYGTNNEFGFDYLRDNLEYEKNTLRQRLPAEGGYHFAIVDEIDSILIDEARTPLIISGPVANTESLYGRFADIARRLEPEIDYTVDEKIKQISLTDAGIEKAERLLGVENIYTDAGIKYVHHLETAVRARAIFERDRDYVVNEGQVVIVDEFTGRMQPGRRWSEGLHQAIEAKEGVPIQQESRTFASITYQNYFRLYDKLAGMTGTAKTSAEEFYKVYGLNTVSVPTNVETRRTDHDDMIFQTERGKFKAIARMVKELHEKGQPVLVGTVSVEKNELLAAHFKQEGIPHELLNAKNHEREGEIIAQAGKRGGVTIATNMAGRGVDIKLGGNPAPEGEYEAVKERGGLFVLGTERHEARRIDNQLRGRSGRQGDPGETQFFVSLEDSLMRVFASDTIKRLMGSFGIPEDEPIYNRVITRSLERAQTKIEEFHFDARKQVLAYDDVMNIQRQSIYRRRRDVLTGERSVVDEELARMAEGNSEFAEIIATKREELGEDAFYEGVRRLLLQTIDMLWVDHLETMQHLRGSVSLRAYGQRDPLVEYKREGLEQFRQMELSYEENVRRLLPQLTSTGFAPREDVALMETKESPRTLQDAQNIEQGARHVTAGGGAPVRKASTYGRNDHVTITNGTETKEMKFKKAGSLLATGQWRIVENR